MKLMDGALTLAKRAFIIAGLVVLVLLMMDFNSRMAELTRLNAQHQREGTLVGEMESTEQHLQTQIAYATSEAAVEAWARQEARWARPGDKPIIPMSDTETTPEPPQPVVATPQPLSNWEAWLLWFFGSSP